ncbi:MAG: hypothetical protein Tsb0034_02130 [Ekhidna sp.]
MNNWVYIALVAAALAIHAMIDVIMKRFDYGKKMMWFAIVVLIPLLGPLVYYVRRKSLITQAKEEA